MGTDGVNSFFVLEPRTAYSSTENKYHIVWASDDNANCVYGTWKHLDQ